MTTVMDTIDGRRLITDLRMTDTLQLHTVQSMTDTPIDSRRKATRMIAITTMADDIQLVLATAIAIHRMEIVGRLEETGITPTSDRIRIRKDKLNLRLPCALILVMVMEFVATAPRLSTDRKLIVISGRLGTTLVVEWRRLRLGQRDLA